MIVRLVVPLLWFFSIATTTPLVEGFLVVGTSLSSVMLSGATNSRAAAAAADTTTTTTLLYSSSSSPKSDPVAQDALEKTAARLEKLRRQTQDEPNNSLLDYDHPDPLGVERQRLYRQYLLQAANSLKLQLKERKLPRNGRKPDLAMRLAEDDLQQAYGGSQDGKTSSSDISDSDSGIILVDDNNDGIMMAAADSQQQQQQQLPLERFASLHLSKTAGQALHRAGFGQESPIQAAVIPAVARGESLIVHAETGSGKTLAYLLPLTERLWARSSSGGKFSVIMTPTRELAAQVAGIAAVLAPPNTVRLVSRPTNLMSDGVKDRGERSGTGGRYENNDDNSPQLFIGSARAIMQSLYGDGKKMPASPTPKPAAMAFLRNVQTVVMDEVDRLLAVKKSKSDKLYKKQRRHEKPAAIVCAAVTRLSLGQAQIVAASATVGRPLKRELSRVLGLPAQECPAVVRAAAAAAAAPIVTNENEQEEEGPNRRRPSSGTTTGRAVTIPESVENYVVAVDEESSESSPSPGKLLTAAYGVIQSLGGKKPSRRMLMVLTKGFGINTQNAIGALRHFRCQPEPRSLLDALQAEGTERMIEVHREVSGASGIGESAYLNGKGGDDDDDDDEYSTDHGYLLVTGEDSVRGLHLDGLDSVIVVGRPNGPDEYTHIAGRTGRAGRPGKVFNILGEAGASALVSWEHMLNVKFHRVSQEEVASLD